MRLKYLFYLIPVMGLVALSQSRPGSIFRTKVDLVEVSFVVTDDSGKYVPGLKSDDLRVLEDGREQHIRSFVDSSAAAPDDGQAAANIWVLFDTSSSVYSTFPQTEDSIAAFIRSARPRDSIAINSFSRNVSHLSPLSLDHDLALHNLREAVAGDQNALYNAILLTVLDAAKTPGRKSIIVFSNGPDDSSVLSPEDVGRVAEREGVPIYLFSRGRNDTDTIEAMRSLASRTGGQVYNTRTRGEQLDAFAGVHNDLRHTYLLTYSPLNRPEPGFRKIELQIPGRSSCHLRSRAGYTVE